ncbi:hypothetical protein CBR_g8277 [Chara braunii]|uniref:Peptidase A2 domain-containing protein n=1 Tax=Chara braunii TaxID=69332 RepID=A0A388KLR4_CHABU|nr:hypothetical protein CBR_g8277 [Chara braunii]|eukprot:GBG70977.1 hypothetical protein CBR_g8277 [Chara braunii]
MPETGGASGAPKKDLTLDGLIAAIGRHERNPKNIPEVDTFHFCGERVSEWLERVEQALVGRLDVVKFQRILQYVLHSYHQEVKKVIDAAQGSWERFKEGMQRKSRLGDGLLTTADLEAMNKEDFTTIGTFVQEFKKRPRKVHEISEEAQCAIFLGLLTASEAVELTRHGGGSTKLTLATIDRGVEVGCLDQVEQRQVRLQRQKRKERDATASGTPGVTRIVTDVLAQLGYGTESVVQRRVVTAVQVKGTEPVIEEAVQEELWEEEESVPQRLTKAQRKVDNLAQGGQGSGKAQAPQAVAAAPPGVAAPLSSAGPSQGGAPSYGQWPWPVINAIVPWGSPPPVAGPQMSMLPPIYPTAQAQPMAPLPSPAPSSQGSVAGGGNQGQGNQDNGGRGGGRGRGRNGGGREGQWNSQGRGNQGQGYQGQGNQGQGYPGQGYQGQGDQGSQGYGRPRFDWRTVICQHCDQQGHTIRFCNIRREDERGTLISSTMDRNIYDQFGEAIDRRLGGVRAEAQRRAAAGTPPPATFRLWQEKEEPPIGVEEVGSDEEVTQGPRGGSRREEPIIIESDDEDEERRMESPSVLLGKMDDLLNKARLTQASRTRSQAKASVSQEPPRREPEPGKRKEAVEVEDDDDEEEEDERLRREEDQRAEQRARKKGTRGEAESVIRDEPPKRKKYAVRLEEGFDVEKVIDRLLEGHNDLMTLKEILASAPRFRDELKGRLSRRLVPNIHLGTILPKEAEWAESGTKTDWKCMACGTVDLVVKGSKCAAMVDTGAKMNIIREADAIRFGLDIDRSDCGILHGASCKAVFCGTTSNVLIEVEKEGEAVENTPPVDGFLDQEEYVRLHINKWSPRVPSCVDYPIWQTPSGYERRAELVLKPFEEEDPWGGKDVQWMMELALASSHSLVEDIRTIEEGPGQIERHEDLMGGMYLLVNTLLEESLDQLGSLNPAGNVDEVPESQDDEFEEGEIKEAFHAEEYDGIYLELGLLLSCEMRLRDASYRAQKMLQRYLVRDGHLFVRREVGNPRRVVCGRNRQIDVLAALHDGIAGGHRWVQATYAKRLEAAGALPGQPPSEPAKAPEIPKMWRDFWEQRGEELPSPIRAGFGVARKAEERLDRKIKFLAKTTFDRHLLLESDLAGKKIKEAGDGVRLEAMEVEIQELRASVASQAAIIESLRQRSQGGADKPESSRRGE